MNQQITPDSFDSWDSLEGWYGTARPAKAARHRAGTVRERGQRALLWIGERVPGFFLAATLAVFADAAADWIGRDLLGYRTSPVSGIPIAIVLGVALCNGIGIPSLFQEGLRTCMRPIQRLAIVLLGWRLSLGVVGGIGLRALPVVLVSITVALWLIPRIGVWLGLSRKLAVLVAVGTSICGVSAIMATAPTIDADESEVSYAVACVAIFGMLAMLFYPLLIPFLLGKDLTAIGIFLGSAIHDTAQVTGAALAYQQAHHAPEVLNTATVVKIMRNLSMAAVIPLMALLFRRGAAQSRATRPSWTQIFPLFVFGFVAMTLLRTVGDAAVHAYAPGAAGLWAGFLALMDHGSTWLLTVVMAAVGLSTGLSSLRKLGILPFLIGLAAAIIVGAVGLGMIKLLPVLGL